MPDRLHTDDKPKLGRTAGILAVFTVTIHAFFSMTVVLWHLCISWDTHVDELC